MGRAVSPLSLLALQDGGDVVGGHAVQVQVNLEPYVPSSAQADTRLLASL